MKDAHIAEAFREDFTTMVVMFADQTVWTYKVLKEDLPKYKVATPVLIPHVSQGAPAPTARPVYKAQLNSVQDFPHVKAGIIISIHDEPDIDFNAEFAYKWVVAPLDMGPYQDNVNKDAEILASVQKARNKRVREQVKEALMGANEELKNLLAGS